MDLHKDLADALRKRDALRVSTLRLLISALHNREIEKQRPLTEEEALAVIRLEVKKRRESVELFRRGKREELARREEEELKILERYLPAAMSAEELERLVAEAARECGAAGPRDAGKVMGVLMKKLSGRSDGQAARQAVEKYLAGLSS